MPDQEQNSTAPAKSEGFLEPGVSNIQLIYILYLLGFIVGITPLIGVIVAYMNRGKSEAWLESHYTWVIRTFWIGLLYGLIAMILMFVVIGFPLMIAIAVWFIVRVIKGLQVVGRREAIANPESWII